DGAASRRQPSARSKKTETARLALPMAGGPRRPGRKTCQPGKYRLGFWGGFIADWRARGRAMTNWGRVFSIGPTICVKTVRASFFHAEVAKVCAKSAKGDFTQR